MLAITKCFSEARISKQIVLPMLHHEHRRFKIAESRILKNQQCKLGKHCIFLSLSFDALLLI